MLILGYFPFLGDVTGKGQKTSYCATPHTALGRPFTGVTAPPSSQFTSRGLLGSARSLPSAKGLQRGHVLLKTRVEHTRRLRFAPMLCKDHNGLEKTARDPGAGAQDPVSRRVQE